jgi:hypothetical protein
MLLEFQDIPELRSSVSSIMETLQNITSLNSISHRSSTDPMRWTKNVNRATISILLYSWKEVTTAQNRGNYGRAQLLVPPQKLWLLAKHKINFRWRSEQNRQFQGVEANFHCQTTKKLGYMSAYAYSWHTHHLWHTTFWSVIHKLCSMGDWFAIQKNTMCKVYDTTEWRSGWWMHFESLITYLIFQCQMLTSLEACNAISWWIKISMANNQ